jgi:cephalosporin-C deacetylase-like acetyl esterase
MRCIVFSLVTLLAIVRAGFAADAARRDSLAEFVRQIDPRVATAPDAESPASAEELRRMLSDDVRERRRLVNEQDVRRWRGLRSVEDWRRMKKSRMEALQRSLGEFPEPPRELNVRVTRTISGDGFRIECLVFESRPGLLVTANLYRPAPPRESMPGILICHSHHNPKTQEELQDMGVNWARSGCLVLVMDQLGHGERRQHPFRAAEDYEGEFRVGRQDYYFRYNVGVQLHLVGESLIGWMVWDLMRGVDLLLDQPGVDSNRIMLLGAVAGGGDPCAVTAALDERIQVAVPFNFGGPQPESVFPLPDDAELSFNYVGGGSWESTRNLRLSARDGFLPWVIVGNIAPRRLIYAHEFSWDREQDPVWRRLQTIYQWFDASENLASLHGYGRVTLSSNEASHCNNIGAYHRLQMYPPLQRWCGMEAPEPEQRDRRERPELYCVEGVDSASGIRLPKVCELADRIARERLARQRRKLHRLSAEQRREQLRADWAQVLGYEPPRRLRVPQVRAAVEKPIRVMKLCGRTDRFLVPVILLAPERPPNQARPCVVAVAQGGKAGFLEHRSAEIVGLLEKGIAVCLPDLPGSGETSPGAYRGRRSSATGISSGRLMLGGTMVGDRLSDLLSLIQWLRTLDEVDGRRIAVWGDSFAPINPPGRNVVVPLGIDDEPELAEPTGAALSLLAALFDSRVQAVLARNGLVSIRSILDSQALHVPHDFVVPGALTAGDLPDIAAAIGPRPVRVEGLVDGLNGRASEASASAEWDASARRSPSLSVSAAPSDGYIAWLTAALDRDE